MAKKKETTQSQNNKKVVKTRQYAYIDDFVKTAKSHFGLRQGEIEGFKVYMVGKFYQFDEKDFIPYLEDYLGKKLV